jgi:hypothetical protein
VNKDTRDVFLTIAVREIPRQSCHDTHWMSAGASDCSVILHVVLKDYMSMLHDSKQVKDLPKAHLLNI